MIFTWKMFYLFQWKIISYIFEKQKWQFFLENFELNSQVFRLGSSKQFFNASFWDELRSSAMSYELRVCMCLMHNYYYKHSDEMKLCSMNWMARSVLCTQNNILDTSIVIFNHFEHFSFRMCVSYMLV